MQGAEHSEPRNACANFLTEQKFPSMQVVPEEMRRILQIKSVLLAANSFTAHNFSLFCRAAWGFSLLRAAAEISPQAFFLLFLFLQLFLEQHGTIYAVIQEFKIAQVHTTWPIVPNIGISRLLHTSHECTARLCICIQESSSLRHQSNHRIIDYCSSSPGGGGGLLSVISLQMLCTAHPNSELQTTTKLCAQDRHTMTFLKSNRDDRHSFGQLKTTLCTSLGNEMNDAGQHLLQI